MSIVMSIVTAVVFAASAAAAVVTIVGSIVPQWRRILSLMLGRVEQPAPPLCSNDRWRRVHVEADKRAPYAVEGRRS